MHLRSILQALVAMILAVFLYGCSESFSTESDYQNIDTAVTNNLGLAYLSYSRYDSTTVAVRDSVTNAALSNIQVLGMVGSDGECLYVAADPLREYHPIISSGKSNGDDTTQLYLPGVDRQTETNATIYSEVNGGLLHDMTQEYLDIHYQTTIGGLRDELADLAYGKSAAMVVCATQPINSYTGRIPIIEIAQRHEDLSSALQLIGWQSLYTSRGFATDQSVTVSVIDTDLLHIAAHSAGALSDTAVIVVTPNANATGTIDSGALRVELEWNAPVDLDLHLIRNYADLYDPYDDCYWRHTEQAWGSRTAQFPRLISDNRDGSDTETIVLDELNPADDYSVVIDYWGDPEGRSVNQSVTATVRVWTQNNTEPRVFTVAGLYHGLLKPEMISSSAISMGKQVTSQ